MIEFVLTVGCSGSGKTTWAHKHDDTHLVVDSDEMRKRLLNDEARQDQNALIFNEMCNITCNALRAGQSVIYSATNLVYRRRASLVKLLRSKFPNVHYRCVVMNTPIDLCRERNSARSRIVPSFVIDKQAKQFQCPLKSEGWDEIEVVDNYCNDGKLMLNGNAYTYRSIYGKRVSDFGSQNNSHHTLSLIDHCEKCGKLAHKAKCDFDIVNACFIHDYGKCFTQTYWDKDDRKEAHYPNHGNVSALMALTMGYGLHVAQLVNYHMVPYGCETEQKVWRARMGEELWTEVQQLHQYDQRAH